MCLFSSLLGWSLEEKDLTVDPRDNYLLKGRGSESRGLGLFKRQIWVEAVEWRGLGFDNQTFSGEELCGEEPWATSGPR